MRSGSVKVPYETGMFGGERVELKEKKERHRREEAEVERSAAVCGQSVGTQGRRELWIEARTQVAGLVQRVDQRPCVV